MGWTLQEELVCCLETGQIFMYDIRGHLLRTFSLGPRCEDAGVRDCLFWGSGLVVLTNDKQLIAVSDFSDPRPQQMADPKLLEFPSAFAIIEPQYSLSGNVEVLLGVGNTIINVDFDNFQDLFVEKGPFTRFSFDDTGNFIACFTLSGSLLVFKADFSENLTEFDTKSKIPPLQLVWCGRDSVLMYWDKIVIMLGPQGEWIKYNFEESVVLLPECDGVRILSPEKCEFLQRVPDATEDVYKIGSIKPGATLFEAWEHFQRKSPKSDEFIRLLGPDLPAAVSTCIEAALHEFDYSQQKPLLQAASFGKSFLENAETQTDAFVDACKTLRILDTVRDYKIGLPLTIAQYQKLTLEVVCDRLVHRHHHLLALKICKYANIRPEGVLVHWACEKVKGDGDDTEIRDAIVSKIGNESVSYVQIAETANRVGRPELAVLLLDQEPRAAKQVPLLMHMNQEDAALVKALESGDADLVYYVIFQVKKMRSLAEFFKLVRGRPAAVDLLVTYCRDNDPELLKTFYYQADQPQESANVAVAEAYKIKDLDTRISEIQKGMQFYQDNKDYAVHAKAMEDQIRLYEIQRELSNSSSSSSAGAAPVKPIGMSVNETISTLLLRGDTKRAEKLRDLFKVPDKRWWWLKITAFGQRGDWDGLQQFAREKKSPIGWEPFAEVCLKYDKRFEALHYINRISELPSRAQFLIQINMWKEAAEVAFQLKNVDMLQMIRSRTQDRDAHAVVDNALRVLTQK
eukprot:TRINITY_DN7652_c0_g1_i1.p1 TRINITY_DN7652_c0_g1~~TRINITY_DN7652_c0_g1_i1.p1  ORF type:complete len:835 (-),score=183.11 TRINITY_DN7652_c0_g1_i1:116-2338(-)